MGTSISRRGVLAGASVAGVMASMPAFAKAGPGGFSPEGLKGVTGAMQAAIDRGDAAGVVTLLYRHGEIAQVDAVGYQDEAAKTPMRRATIFRIASMTKPITAVATLMLIEEGKFGLSTPVENILPELADRKLLAGPADPLNTAKPAPHGILVSDLLTHRSGIVTPDTAPGRWSRR